MINKLKRFSYSQLILLQYFLKHDGEIVTVADIEKHTPLEDKSLGGVLSSLTRTSIKGERLIEPLGKALDGVGLRWKLNSRIIDIEETRREIRRLLATYG